VFLGTDFCRLLFAACLGVGVYGVGPLAPVPASAQTADSGENQVRQFYLPRARQGDVSAQYFLGHIYQNGIGVRIDKAEAAAWFGRAAEGGHGPAQYRLAVMLQIGDGVERDPARALDLYRQAASAGLLEAQFNLAQMIERGDGTEAAPWVAKEMYEVAAEEGMPEAMRALGRLYARGIGTEQDAVSAWVWLSLAARNGDRQAGQLASLLSGDMTEEQLAEARRRLDAVPR